MLVAQARTLRGANKNRLRALNTGKGLPKLAFLLAPLRKTLVPRPTQTSAAVPSKAHLRVLTSRAVCSLYQWYSPAGYGCPSSEKAICAGEEGGSGPGTPSVIRCPVSIQCPVVSMPGPIVTGDTPIFVTHPV